MLVTRTERYTDWHYQSAHANEQAATVGVGLLRGHIYYRHSYDMLKSGDKVIREKSFVLLSDGSTYELGQGLSGEKINIQFVGLTSSDEVYITVEGKQELGVGVTSVFRDVTIQYDDGRVPVLDTDQLKGIMAELSDSLTQSMVDTAEQVKKELAEQVETARVEVTAHADSVANSAKDTAISEASQMMQRVSGSANDEMDRKDLVVTNQMSIRMDAKTQLAQWIIGQYTTAVGGVNNLTSADPTQKQGSNKFVWDSTNKTVKFTGTDTDKPRIFRVTLNANLDIADSTTGYFHLQLKNSNDGIIAQSVLYVSRADRMINQPISMQLHAEVFVPATMKDHPLLTNGIRVGVLNESNGIIKVLSSSAIIFALESM